MSRAALTDGYTANGVFLASSAPFAIESATPSAEGPGCLMLARFPSMTLLGCYFSQLNANGASREWTWHSTKGNGFRIDHALGNGAFVASAAQFAPTTIAPRETGLTDHSAVVVRLATSARVDQVSSGSGERGGATHWVAVRLFGSFFLRHGGQFIALHRKADRFVPAATAEIDLHIIRTEVLQIGRVAHWRGFGSLHLRDRHGLEVCFSEALGRFLFIVDVKADVVNAAQIGCLPHAELRRTGLAVFENREINIAVAEPDTLFTGVSRSAIELG